MNIRQVLSGPFVWSLEIFRAAYNEICRLDDIIAKQSAEIEELKNQLSKK